MKKENSIELLAPAGNMECLKAAVSSGADAVYFAGKLFGARSYADNFSDEEIACAVSYCHLRGVKVYITVNTLISDREIPEAMEYIKMLSEIGVDAVIVQDLGLCSLILENFPDLPVHGSTQMTVHNSKGVKVLEKMGLEQVVLSRELSLSEIRKIKNETNAKLEVFAHGALCMSYSGQCLMSSVLGGRSGNRGKCAQPCRLEYKINENPQKGFYLSLKDLCALEHINEFKEIGVSSLKIEGRMKGAAYVRAVVGIYRKYIDSGEMPTAEDIEKLDRIFFRGGLTDGYLADKNGREMFCFDKPDNPYERQEKAAFEEENCERKIRLFAKVVIKEGECPHLTVSGGNIEVTAKGDEILPKGEKKIVDAGLVCEKLKKTGGTPFEFDDIDVAIKGSPFMSVGSINDLRRKALTEYEKEFLAAFKRKASYCLPEILDKERGNSEFTCRIMNWEQFKEVQGFDFARIYVPDYVILENPDEFLPYKDKIVIETDAIVKDESETEKRLEKLKKLGFSKLCVGNIGFADEENFELYGGVRLNIFGGYSLMALNKKGFKSAILSPELNIGAIRDMKKPIDAEVMVYGHLPLMITENCIVRNNNACPCKNDINYLTDRKGIKFPIVKDGKNCRSVVLNSIPLFMGDKLDEIRKSGVTGLMLYFTVESPKQVSKICRIFQNGEKMTGEYTRLHYNKGVL